MEQEGQSILIAIFTLVFLCIIMIILFVIFQKRKNTLLLKQKEIAKHYEEEIVKTQLEIREETFRKISWELHDNIGQLLTLAKIQLQNSSTKEDVKNTLDKSLKELRALSKNINPDVLENILLTDALQLEIARFNKLNFIKATCIIKGTQIKMDSRVEIVFFRILQEFFSNTIKHARATHLSVILNFSNDKLTIIAEDDGQGFDANKISYSGIGLANIKSRAKLVNAQLTIKSQLNIGTKLTIKYPFQ
jgi:signal transduction histidine kinase